MHVINNALWIMSSILLLIDLLQSSHINQLFILTFFEVFINFAVFINIVSPDHLCTVGPRSPSPMMGLTDSYERFTRRHQTPRKRLLEKKIPGTPLLRRSACRKLRTEMLAKCQRPSCDFLLTDTLMQLDKVKNSYTAIEQSEGINISMVTRNFGFSV